MRRLLAVAGHEVLTPTLTGMWERTHLARPEVGLQTHIQDIINVLEYEDLRDAVLVGWSYGGMVLSGVVDRVPHRLAHVIYGDAAVPHDGEALLDLFPPPMRAQYEAAIGASVDGWRISADNARRYDARYTDTLIRTLTDRMQITNASAVGERIHVPHTFIFCAEQKKPDQDPSVLCARRARAVGWRYAELAAPHAAPLTHPRETAALLLHVIGFTAF